ncbi:MAG: acetyl-CoA carboxylase biotin carboxyl carrier protein subunit [Chloroflexi bacterium]|nr:acetyl-CoA carboxylase biotin carboxyl carrier protein subunit [Chloroflexota bacterium]
MPTTLYQVTLGERTLRVALRRAGDVTFVRVDDADEQPVQLGHVHGALKSLVLGQRRIELLATPNGAVVSLAIGGLEYRAEVLDEAHARLASVAGVRASGHARHELKAPMPGLLVKILCQVGDEIEAGQPVALLQAMKMENELSLPRGGRVTSIGAAAGQTVEQGQILVVVE